MMTMKIDRRKKKIGWTGCAAIFAITYVVSLAVLFLAMWVMG